MEIRTRPLAEWTPGLALFPGEVHVWVAALAEPDGGWQGLSPDEWERARNFRIEKPRGQFIASRSLLRTFLAGYIGGAPAAVPICYESAGKPVLEGCPLHFNVTHSEERALFAFARSGRVGIDIERIRPMENAESIVGRFFAAGENAAFRALPADRQLPAFYRIWTRKEALLKALGQGIHALELCEITVDADPPRVLKLMDDADCGRRWLLRDLDVGEGYAAAVAVEADIGECRTSPE